MDEATYSPVDVDKQSDAGVDETNYSPVEVNKQTYAGTGVDEDAINDQLTQQEIGNEFINVHQLGKYCLFND